MSRSRSVAAIAATLSLAVILTWWLYPSEKVDPTAPRAKQERDLVVRRDRSHPKRLRPQPTPLPEAEPPAEGPNDLVYPERASGLVDIVDENGRPDDAAWVVPVDCPGWAHAERMGEYTAAAGRCIVRAARQDGALFSRGPLATLDLKPSAQDDPQYVQLLLAEKRTGGIGIRFQPGPSGILVMQVSPGSPAFAAGLEPGDLIVAVGGEDVANLDADAFVERMTGAVGTDVEFTVGIQSDTGISEETVRVTRAFLDI